MSDATYGTVQVGRLVLRETFEIKADVNAGTGVRTVTITGEESAPPLTETALLQRNEDIMTMRDMIMPISWTNKSSFDGFYFIDDISASLVDYTHDEVKKFTWQIRAIRYGPDNSAEIESRLTGVKRQNEFGLDGEPWHAPSAGAYAYYTGSTRPANSFERDSEDGDVTIYRDIPPLINPRWTIATTDYRNGRARVKVDGLERTGTNMSDGNGSWEIGNGIVNATPGPSGQLTIGAWNGSDYDTKNWNVSIGASGGPGVGDFPVMTVIRNDFEMATIRLMRDQEPGRATLDLSVRRGSRFVEGYLESDISTTLGVWMHSAEASTAPASGGYVVATSNDAEGHKGIVGSTRAFIAQTTRGGLHKNSSTFLDFFLGVVYDGASAQSGDAAAVVMDHYISAMSEMTMAVLR